MSGRYCRSAGLHSKQFTLGVAMVAAISIGLAVTLVTIGMAASWASRKASATWPWLDRVATELPYLSAGLVMMTTHRKPN